MSLFSWRSLGKGVPFFFDSGNRWGLLWVLYVFRQPEALPGA
jgi:hypothetical protein